MVHIGDYGFAHVWEIQQLKPGGVGGSESMIDSQDTLSTCVGTNDRVLPVTAANQKELLPICDHMTNRMVPIPSNKETVTICEHRNERLVPITTKDMLSSNDYSTDGMLPVSHNKEMIPMYTAYQRHTVPVNYKDSNIHTCDTAFT